MKRERIIKSIESGELKLSFWQTLTHYGIVMFILIIPVTFIVLHILDFFKGEVFSFIDGEVWIYIISLIFGFIFFWNQKKVLKFKIVKANLTKDKINEIIKSVSLDLEWEAWYIDERVIIAKTRPGFFSGSWGEQITIIFDNGKIMINSINDPDKRSSIVSFGRNRKNIEVFINNINKSLIQK